MGSTEKLNSPTKKKSPAAAPRYFTHGGGPRTLTAVKGSNTTPVSSPCFSAARATTAARGAASCGAEGRAAKGDLRGQENDVFGLHALLPGRDRATGAKTATDLLRTRAAAVEWRQRPAGCKLRPAPASWVAMHHVVGRLRGLGRAGRTQARAPDHTHQGASADGATRRPARSPTTHGAACSPDRCGGNTADCGARHVRPGRLCAAFYEVWGWSEAAQTARWRASA